MRRGSWKDPSVPQRKGDKCLRLPLGLMFSCYEEVPDALTVAADVKLCR